MSDTPCGEHQSHAPHAWGDLNWCPGCEVKPPSRIYPKGDDCDCTYDGNDHTIGPRCRQRIDDAWAEAMAKSRKISRGEQ